VEHFLKGKKKNLGADPTDPKMGVDWKNLTINQNNRFGYYLNFSMDMIDYKLARFSLTDGLVNRYSIPDFLVNKPQSQKTMRLEMLGFSYNLSPFSFAFSDVLDKTNTFVTTEN
jgi:hypothetical protein